MKPRPRLPVRLLSTAFAVASAYACGVVVDPGGDGEGGGGAGGSLGSGGARPEGGTGEPATGGATALGGTAGSATGGAAAGSGTGGKGAGGTGGCPDNPVWTPASSAFTLTESGGMVGAMMLDAGCGSFSISYGFSASDRTLSKHACLPTGPVDHLLRLTEAEADSIVANIASIHTTCQSRCGADAPDIVITVQASGVASTYNSNFYSGCAARYDSKPVNPPWVPFEASSALGSFLDRLISAGCEAAGAGGAGAGGADAGACT